MTIAISISFPLGRYHATPWDRHVNEGEIEWPPSPWRLARALVAVWKERLPELPEPIVIEAIEAISAPPSYDMPRWRSSATRHYYPAGDHLPPKAVSTDKVVDAFVAVDPDAELQLSWENAILSAPARDALAELVAALPYLGRADSICTAEVLDQRSTAGEERLDPDHSGELLISVPQQPIDLQALTTTTDAMRKARLARPRGMARVAYPRPRADDEPALRSPTAAPPAARIDAVVFSVSGHPAPAHTLAVPVAETLLAAAKKRYTALTGEPAPPVLTGHPTGEETKRTDQHRHAHVLPLASSTGRIEQMVVWAPEGLDARDTAALGAVSTLRYGRRSADDSSGDREASVIRGFGPTRVLLTAIGDLERLRPELCGPAVEWISTSPFIPTHHPKPRHRSERGSSGWMPAYLREEVQRELSYRAPHATVVEVGLLDETKRPVPAQRYRRYRRRERLADARRGVWIELRFSEPVTGPLALDG